MKKKYAIYKCHECAYQGTQIEKHNEETGHRAHHEIIPHGRGKCSLLKYDEGKV